MGSATNSSGYLYVRSSISLIGTNKYRMTITPTTSSSSVWNAYGINVYAYIGSSKNYVGIFTVSDGVCSPSSFTYDFTVSSNTQVYAQGACSHCGGAEDGWISTSSADTATYTNPNSPPSTPTISCSTNPLNGNYYGESSVVITLSTVTDPDGNAVSYRIYGQYKPPGGSFTNWNGGSDDLVSTDRARTVDITKFERGTQFRFWGYAKDSNDAWSGKSNVIENVYKNRIPSTPTITCSNTIMGGNYIGEDNISLSLSTATDPDGHTVEYAIYGQYNDGSGWKNIGGGDGLLSNSRSASVNIASYARGTRFQFWGFSFDSLGAWSLKSNIISNIYKNKAPNTPTMSCSNTSINGRYIAEDSITVSLSAVTDPEGDLVFYKLYGQYNDGGGWKSLGDSNSLIIEQRSTTITISSYARGTQFKFWGFARDTFGAISAQSNTLENIYRNRVGTVSGIAPASKTITDNTIPLTWNATVDPDGQSVTYNIFVKKNNGSYSKIASQSQNSYSYNITNDPKGTLYKFKISANDGMADTAEVESPSYKKDFKPVLILPINTCTLYQNNPRIVFSRISSSDVYTCVSYNSNNYNSKNNGAMFTTSNTTVNGETAHVFKSTGLNTGSNTITIYNSDGTFNSSSITLTITVENLVNSILSEIVTKTSIDTIRSKANIARKAYVLTDTSFESTTKGSSLINLSDITSIRTALDNIRTKINTYDSNKKLQSWNSISKGNVIKRVDYEQLIDSIKNL